MNFMKDRFFLDTNILVYANDTSAPLKQAVARELVGRAFSSGLGCLSPQVLQEFFVVAVGKAGVPPHNARTQITRFSQLHLAQVDSHTVIGAIDLHLVHQISFWDALVVKAASSIRCSTLYTEDLNHGQVIDGVTVVNPFIG